MNRFVIILIGTALFMFIVSFFSGRLNHYIFSVFRNYFVRKTALMTFISFFALIVGIFLLCIYASTGIVYLLILFHVLGYVRRTEKEKFRTVKRRSKNRT